MATVAVIPARAGSKGLPGKHLRLLGGEPLIQHTIRASLAATRIDRTIVSTNDPAIARAARRAGAEVPFLRPDELALDATPTPPVVRHAVEWLEATGEHVDVVVTLQPTTPLRQAAEVDLVVALLDDPSIDSAVTVTELGVASSAVGAIVDGRLQLLTRGRDVRRQAVPPAVRLTGGVYVTRRRLLDADRLLGDAPAALVVTGGSSIDIDVADDLRLARRALASIRRRTAPAGRSDS